MKTLKNLKNNSLRARAAGGNSLGADAVGYRQIASDCEARGWLMLDA